MWLMNRLFRPEHLTRYEQDYALWCAEQGALLRAGRLDALDRENLAEEIESLGRSDRRAIESRLKPLLVHLLKWQFQPEGRSGSWRATIDEQRKRIAKILRESPSLKTYPQDVLQEEYGFARWAAIEETGLPEEAFPEAYPFGIDQVLDSSFFPGGNQPAG